MTSKTAAITRRCSYRSIASAHRPWQCCLSKRSQVSKLKIDRSLIHREIHPSHHIRSINSLWSNHSAKLPSAERYLLIVFRAIAGLPSEAFASINFRNDRLSNALMSAALEGHSTSLCFQSRTALRLTLETSEVSPMNSAKSFTNFRLRSQVSVDPPIRWAADPAAIAFSSPAKRY